jgi:hypothetical protein
VSDRDLFGFGRQRHARIIRNYAASDTLRISALIIAWDSAP